MPAYYRYLSTYEIDELLTILGYIRCERADEWWEYRTARHRILVDSREPMTEDRLMELLQEGGVTPDRVRAAVEMMS